MSKMRVVTLTTLCFLLLAGFADAQVKKRIAVSRFRDFKDYPGCGVGVADMLATALVKSGKFSVIERKEIEQVLKEQKLGLSDLVTPETAPQVGKLLGVEMLVVGSVSELGTKKKNIGGGLGVFGAGISHDQARATVDIRLVNTTTGEIIAAEAKEGTETTLGVAVRYEQINFGDATAWDNTDLGKATREAINGCVEMIVDNAEKIPWTGRIIKVNADGTILMKPGSVGNVTTGMEFEVFKQGDDLVDPDTGQSLGKEEAKIGRIKAVSDMLNGKACKASVVSGSGFAAGQVIRLPAE
jgi:curli biogenesis system outer membrane secretion channel CsgG